MKVMIHKDQRGLLFIKGDYSRVLGSGAHTYWKFLNQDITVMDVTAPFTIQNRNLEIFLQDPELLKLLDVCEVADYQIALHYQDNRFVEVLKPGKYAYWNVLQKHSFTIIDTRQPAIPPDLDRSIINNQKMGGFYQVVEVAAYETGLLFYNSVLQNLLEPGKYYYWISPVNVTVQKVDLRQQQLEIQGQEILTQDKVGLRLNFICQYKITDAVKVTLDIKNYQEQIYILLQLVLREYVGNMTLDELLQKKEAIGTFVLEQIKPQGAHYGVEFVFAGLKDIILPGEIRDIMNTVLIAEKKAQANIITRREETASTRSLLNTARLMEENPTLSRLKELEYLERICEKIGSISVMSGPNIMQSLTALINPVQNKKE